MQAQVARRLAKTAQAWSVTSGIVPFCRRQYAADRVRLIPVGFPSRVLTEAITGTHAFAARIERGSAGLQHTG